MAVITGGSSIKAVLLDWAGTTIDHGSRAPVMVILEIFRRRGINITVDEARGPMGKAKRQHIAAIIALPRIRALWTERIGRVPSDFDVQSMYEEFLPLQKQLLADYSDVIPGVPEAIDTLRAMGVKIGSTTGYTRELMKVVAPLAAAAGYSPDITVCADDVPDGRPAPWMNFLAAQQLGVYPMSSIVVVDDTPVGIEAGLNAGAITVAVSRTGNALGLSLAEYTAQQSDQLQDRLRKVEDEFHELGAHYIIPSVSALAHLIQHF